MDEPESIASIAVAGRKVGQSNRSGKLQFTEARRSCKREFQHHQELEGLYEEQGWTVIKLIWGQDGTEYSKETQRRASGEDGEYP